MLKKQKVSSKASLFYTDGCLSTIMFIHLSAHEVLLARLKFIVCVIHYKSSNALNETLLRQHFS